MVLRVLEKTGVMVRAKWIMYKAVVQKLLLYGSESRVITDTMIKVLEGFHHQISRRIRSKTAWCVMEEG